MDDITLQNAANQARGLAIDAIEKCASGHLGLPLGCAEIGAVLFGEILKANPKKPNWLNRDKFVLSAGHGSMFIYSWLHISGYDLSVDDLKNFRQKDSKTPGHPEFGETAGVEATSGPLGQGVANAVGMAISEKMAAATFNTPDFPVFDHKIWCLAGDGCIQEGISSEAAAIAGVMKLGNLVLMYDSNDVTLDAMSDKTMLEDTAKRYESYGWEVSQCNGHDISDVRKTLVAARDSKSDKPKLVIFKTIIGKGIAEIENSAKGHGEGGAKFADSARKSLGLPEEKFYVSQETYAAYTEAFKAREQACADWEDMFAKWSSANPELAKKLDDCLNKKKSGKSAEELLKLIPEFPADDKSATRASGGKIMNALAKELPYMITGAADLFGSTKNYLSNMGDFSAETPNGRNLWFGIREHAMGAITNGIAYAGIFEPSCATFLTFAGYMLGSIRVSALSRLPVQYVFTHDSVGVGMDGPTHQPVEMVSILRCIPRLDVIRPADSEECAAAWAMALAKKDGPTALILSRQNLPLLSIPAQTKRLGALKGAYIAKKESGNLKKIIIATGSELQWAMKAGEQEPNTRVVSMPSMEVFERQSESYKEEVLPSSCQNRIAIEAGISQMWYKYASKVVATDDFGFSADAPYLFDAFAINEKSLLG